MENHESYSYWKRPWQKWPTLALGLLQLWPIFRVKRKFQELLAAGLLSGETGERYLISCQVQWLLSIFMMAVCLGCFFIGVTARSKKQAALGDAILTTLIAAGLLLYLLILRPPLRGPIWGVVLLTVFTGVVDVGNWFRFGHINKKKE